MPVRHHAMGSRLQKDIPPYVIMGVCNPNMGYKVLTNDWNAGIALPCTVFLRQGPTPTSFVAGAMNATQTVGVQRDDRPELQEVAEEARVKLAAVLDALRSPPSSE
jgi:uncharacterized protein (DUF302 family)